MNEAREEKGENSRRQDERGVGDGRANEKGGKFECERVRYARKRPSKVIKCEKKTQQIEWSRIWSKVECGYVHEKKA